MKERPILFSGAMVRAILDGRKTQTRRVVNPQPVSTRMGDDYIDAYCSERPTAENPRGMGTMWCWWTRDNRCGKEIGRCPYGKPGDRLWVRETWAQFPGPGDAIYRADYDDGLAMKLKWSPSIYMPRWASRITLEVTGVRVERLHEITEDDAVREGVAAIPGQDFWSCFCEATHDSFDMTAEPDAEYRREHGVTHVKHIPAAGVSARDMFWRLWDSINGKRQGCAWSDNPWVWVIEFRRVAS